MTEVVENTQEQLDFLDAQEAAAEKEKDWDLYKVILTGDEVEWAARPGVNLDDDGIPQPWNAPARCEVLVKAPSADWAGMQSLRANPSCHTVESAEVVEL